MILSFLKYHLNREGIMIIVQQVKDAVTSPTNINNLLTLEIKVRTTLRYLATKEMQLCSADELGRLSHLSVEYYIKQ